MPGAIRFTEGIDSRFCAKVVPNPLSIFNRLTTRGNFDSVYPLGSTSFAANNAPAKRWVLSVSRLGRLRDKMYRWTPVFAKTVKGVSILAGMNRFNINPVTNLTGGSRSESIPNIDWLAP